MVDTDNIPIEMYWDFSDFDQVLRESNGRSGGLFYVWNPRIFKKVNVIKNHHFIVIFGVWDGMTGITNIVNVYARVDAIDRPILRDNLKSLINSMKWLLVINRGFQ